MPAVGRLTVRSRAHYDSFSVTPDRIILTLPPDPAFARLTRLATLHFLRHHGMHLVEARRRAASVERRSRAALRLARARPAPATLALTLAARGRALEVLLLLLARPEGTA
jgi:hypothetical protein